MNDTSNQSQSGSVDPLALLVVNELRKSGTRAWLGGPSEEEIQLFGAEKAERDFQAVKRRAEAKERKLAELKEATKRKLRKEISHE